MIRAHRDAVMLLLAPLAGAPTLLPVEHAADDDLDQALADGPPTRPRVVVRLSRMPMSSEVLGPHSARLDALVYVACEGSVWDEAAWAMEKTRGVLLDAVPVVAGRSVAPLEHLDSTGPDADRDTAPPVYVGVDIYRLMSV